MKFLFLAFFFSWVIFSLLSSEISSVTSSSSSSSSSAASPGASSASVSSGRDDVIINSKRKTSQRLNFSENEDPSRKRKRKSGNNSDVSNASSSSRSLTPISDTDSVNSEHGKQFTSGTKDFHKKGYEFHHHMGKYHRAIGKAYRERTKLLVWGSDKSKRREDRDTKLHLKAHKSSIAKKIKHRKDYQGIKKGNLQPGPIDEKKSMNRVPMIPNSEDADTLINSRKVVFRKGKGYHHLTAKGFLMVKGEKRNLLICGLHHHLLKILKIQNSSARKQFAIETLLYAIFFT